MSHPIHTTIPSPSILDAARQVHKASQLLYDQGPFSGVMLPEVMCASFSMELMIKSLRAKDTLSQSDSQKQHLDQGIIKGIVETEGSWGHDLSELLRAVEEPVRSRLNEALRELHGLDVDTLVEMVSEFDRTFRDYRYIYECDSRSPGLRITQLHRCQEILLTSIEHMPVMRIWHDA